MTQDTQTEGALDYADNVRRWEFTTPFAPIVHAAPGHSLVLTQPGHADRELVVDPEYVDVLVAALQEARDHATDPMSPALPAKSKEME